MGFDFLHFLGVDNLGADLRNNDEDKKNRHGVLGFIENAGDSVANSVERFGKTAVDLPVEATKGLYFLGKAGVQSAVGDSEGASQTMADLAQSQKDSYLNKEYGTEKPGDLHGLGNAGGLGLDVATMGSGAVEKAVGGEVLKEGAATAGEKALSFLGPTAAKIGVDTAKGAGIGAAYGADQSLIDNQPQDILKDAGNGALLGGAFGGALSGGGALLNKVAPKAEPVVGPAGETVAPADINFYHGSDGGKLKVDNNGNINLGHNAEDVSQFGDVVQLPKDNLTVAQIPTKDAMFKIAADPELKQQYIDKGVDVLQSPDNHSIAIHPESFVEKTGAVGGLRPSPRNMSIEEAMAAQQEREAPAGSVNSAPSAQPEGENLTPVSGEPAPVINKTPEPQLTEPLPAGDHGGPEISALDELNSKIVKGVPTAEEKAVKLSDIQTDAPKGRLAEGASSVYDKLTKGRSLEDDVSKAKASLYDKYTALSDFGKKYEDITGTTLTPENDPAKIASLAAGAEGKMVSRVEQLHEAITSTGANPEDVSRLGVIDQMLTDRSGVKNPLSQQRLSQARAELEAKLGMDNFKNTEKAVQNIRNIQKEMLNYIGEVIGKDAVERITEKNPNYFTKFDAVDHLIDNQSNIQVGSSFNHATNTAIMSRGEGISGKIADPFESMIRQWGKTIAFVETNKVGQAIGKMADTLEKSLGEEGNSLAIKTRDAENVTARIALYKENKEFKPVRDSLDKAISRDSAQAKQLVHEMKAADGELFKAQKKVVVDDVKKGGDIENGALAAAKDLTRSDIKEMMDDVVMWPDAQFKRIRNKIEARDAKLTPLLDDIQAARDQAAGITERMKSNRETAHLLADKPLPDGYEKISYFKNGVKEEVALPKEVADAMKNMNAKQADFITKTASLQSRALRMGATSLNVAFIPKNIIRDAQTAALNTQHQAFQDMASNWVKAFGDAWVGGPTTRAFIDAGGGQAGFFSRGAGNIEKVANDIGKTNADKWGETVSDPKALAKAIITFIPKTVFKGVTKVGEAAEMAPRLAEFKAARNDGLSPEAAAYAGRNITVDFARAGELGQIANQWVPFLNARAQGNVNIWKAIKRDPARASAIIATTMVAPTVATYMWNRQQFSDVYDQIPDYVKQNNFVMIYGNARATNPDGTPGAFTQVIKIPKGEVGQVFGNPLENLLDYAYGHNPESLAGIAADTLSQASPISFSRNGNIDPMLAVSSVLPPAIKGGVENASNHSFFRDAPVVSQKLAKLPNAEQFNENTSPAAKFIGQITGQSPMKIDNMIQAVGGGLGQQIANPSKFVTSPAGTFSGASANEVDNKFYQVIDKTSPLRASASNKINEAVKSGNMDLANQIAADYNAKLHEDFKPFAKEYGHLATQAMLDEFNKQKINLTSATIHQRAAALDAAKKKQLHAQEMAGIITG